MTKETYFWPSGKPIAPGDGYIAEPSKRPIASDAEISIQNCSLEVWISREQLFRTSRCLHHMSLAQSDNELGAVNWTKLHHKAGRAIAGFWPGDLQRPQFLDKKDSVC